MCLGKKIQGGGKKNSRKCTLSLGCRKMNYAYFPAWPLLCFQIFYREYVFLYEKTNIFSKTNVHMGLCPGTDYVYVGKRCKMESLYMATYEAWE